MVDNPNELIPVKVEAIEKETKAFICPHCNTHLQFLVRVQVVGVHETLDGEDYAAARAAKTVAQKTPKKKLPIEIVEQAKKAGVFDKFTATVKIASPYNVPIDLERYFLTWFTRATKVKTPQFAIRPLLPEGEREGSLEVWAFQSIAAVVKDGRLHSFLPYQFVQGRDVPTTLTQADEAIQAAPSTLTLPVWIKTRNGYVAGKGLLFHELKGKAAGAFATTGL